MSQQLRVTRKVDFTGAEQIGIGNGFTNRGTVYYVLGGETDVLGSDSYGGKSWDYPKATITGALAAATTWDTIVVGCNVSATYLEGATLTMSNMGTKLFGAMTSGQTWGVPSIHTHGTETLLIIDAHACEIGFIGFHDQGAGCCVEVGYNNSLGIDPWRNHIHDCYFGGNSTALWGVVMGNTRGSGVATSDMADAPTTVVEDCNFIYFETGDVFMNCGYGSIVRRCNFAVNTGADGIRYYTDGTSRPFAYIFDNRFTCETASATEGINVAQTPTAGYLFIDGNHFINFTNDGACISKRSGYTGLNYLGLTAIAIT